jgi:chemotaxis regulatin CheY-phosphate phosphatase CheZ
MHKDETEQLLAKDKKIKNRWQKYFDKHFNEEKNQEQMTSTSTLRRIRESKVKDTLKKIKIDKTMGLDGIPIKV